MRWWRLMMVVWVAWAGVLGAEEEPGRAVEQHEGSAQEVVPELPLRFDLATALLLAREYNPLVREARARVAQQDGALVEARSARRLKFDLSGSYNETDEGRLQSFGDFTPDSTRWDAGVESSITVFSNGRNKLQVRGIEHVREAELRGAEAVVRDVLTQVQEAFLNAQLAQETVAVQEESIAVLEEQLAFVRSRLDAGVGTSFDVKQAEVAVANARPPLIRAENGYRRWIDQLRRLLGLPFAVGREARDVVLVAADDEVGWSLELEEALVAGLTSRPELVAMQARLEAQRALIAFEGRGQSPLVDVFAGYGVEGAQFGDEGELHGWEAGVRLNWRFSDGGASRGRVQQQKAVLEQMLHQLAAQKLEIEGEIRSAWFDFQEAESLLEAAALATDAAVEGWQEAQNRFKAGQGTQLEVLQLQLQLTQARLQATEARNGLRRAAIRMRRASGLPLEL